MNTEKIPVFNTPMADFFFIQCRTTMSPPRPSKEIDNSPTIPGKASIAYIKLKNKEPQEGIKLAEEASRLNPRLAWLTLILGRCYLDSGDASKSIPELELTGNWLG